MATTTTCDECGAVTTRDTHYVVEIRRGYETDDEQEIVLMVELCFDCVNALGSAVPKVEAPNG